MPTKPYEEVLINELKDPELAAEYLSAALEDGSIEAFLLALRSVAEAHGGVGGLADATQLNRQSLYRMLSDRGNPTLSSLWRVLDSLGIGITFRSTQNAAA